MSFTQMMTVTSHSPQELIDLMQSWHDEQAGTAPGYRGARLLADHDEPYRYYIEVDFASKEEAEQNNGREATEQWAESLRRYVEGEPRYANCEVVFSTG